MSDAPTPPPKQDSSSFIMIFVFMITIMVMLDNNLRQLLGNIVGAIFNPIIGFEGDYPILTILLAGLTMTAISVLIRHKFMDWVAITKNQKVMSAFNKELREARLAGDQSRMDKLMAIQKTLMQDQMAQNTNQMKPMMFSMLIIISIFAWVNFFIVSVENTTFSIPWAYNVSLLRFGPIWQLMPVWIGIYSLISVPLGQVVQKILKEFSFKKRLREIEELEDEPETSDVEDELEEQVPPSSKHSLREESDGEDVEDEDLEDDGEEDEDEDVEEEASDEDAEEDTEDDAESEEYEDDTEEDDEEIVTPKAVGE